MANSKTNDERTAPPKNERIVLPSYISWVHHYYYPQADNMMHDSTITQNDDPRNGRVVPAQRRRSSRNHDDSRTMMKPTQPSSTTRTRRDKCGRLLSEDLVWWEQVIRDSPSCSLLAQDEAHNQPMIFSSSSSSSSTSFNPFSPLAEGDRDDLPLGEACEIMISTIRDHDHDDHGTPEDSYVPISTTRTTQKKLVNVLQARQQYRRDLLKDDMGMFQEQLDFSRYCSKHPEASP